MDDMCEKKKGEGKGEDVCVCVYESNMYAVCRVKRRQSRAWCQAPEQCSFP